MCLESPHLSCISYVVTGSSLHANPSSKSQLAGFSEIESTDMTVGSPQVERQEVGRSPSIRIKTGGSPSVSFPHASSGFESDKLNEGNEILVMGLPVALSVVSAFFFLGISLTAALPAGQPLRDDAVDLFSPSAQSYQPLVSLRSTAFLDKEDAGLEAHGDTCPQMVVESKPVIDYTIFNDIPKQPDGTLAVSPMRTTVEQHVPGFSLRRRADEPPFVPETTAETIDYSVRVLLRYTEMAEQVRSIAFCPFPCSSPKP